MNKYIEKVEAYKKRIISDALAHAEKDYKDAKESYDDTGYDRYFNKMTRVENVINELTAYMEKDNASEMLTRACKEYESEKVLCHEKLKKIKSDLLNKLFYLLKVIPDCTEARSLERYIKNLED